MVGLSPEWWAQSLRNHHPASVQDRDGAAALIKKTRRLFPFVRHVFADGGYSGDNLAADLAAQKVTLEIVKPDLNAAFWQVIDIEWKIAKFEMTWHYTCSDVVVFPDFQASSNIQYTR